MVGDEIILLRIRDRHEISDGAAHSLGLRSSEGTGPGPLTSHVRVEVIVRRVVVKIR